MMTYQVDERSKKARKEWRRRITGRESSKGKCRRRESGKKIRHRSSLSPLLFLLLGHSATLMTQSGFPRHLIKTFPDEARRSSFLFLAKTSPQDKEKDHLSFHSAKPLSYLL